MAFLAGSHTLIQKATAMIGRDEFSPTARITRLGSMPGGTLDSDLVLDT